MTGGLVLHLLLAVHVLAACVWVGGMFYALVVLRPALAVLEPAAQLQLHLLTLKRFFRVIWHVMPLMLLTGWGLIFAGMRAGLWSGWAALPSAVNAMQGFAVVMACVFVYTFAAPWQRLRRAIRPGPEVLARIRSLLALNLAFGIATVAVACFADAG